MKQQMLYRELAKYYDLVYDWKKYALETKKLKKYIARFKRSNDNELLDVACGTGRHLEYLKNAFLCTGLDISDAMLRIAKKRHPRMRFLRGDMTKLNLGETFDVITCLFSSIGYVKTEAKLRRALKSLSKHLKTGGVVLIEGWLEPDTYKPGNLGLNVHDGKDVKVVRMNCGIRRGNHSIMDMHYLIGERNKPVRHFVDRHDMGLFTKEQFVRLMREAGLRPKVIRNGTMKLRNLYVGVKP